MHIGKHLVKIREMWGRKWYELIKIDRKEIR